MLKVKYSDPSEVVEDADGFSVTTSSTYCCDDATVDQLVKTVNRFLRDGEDVEVQIKHKAPKE